MRRAADTRFCRFSSRTVTLQEAMTLFLSKRGQCPVAHSQEFECFHLLLDYSGVKQAMADWETFSSSPSALRPLSGREPFVPLDLDKP